MKRLNYNADSTFQDIEKCFESYKEYLLSVKDKFPEKAFNFAVADWHYDRSNHKCPQTSLIESLEILEREVSESSEATIDIIIKLFAPYKDGKIKLIYSGVRYYHLEKAHLIGVPAKVFNEPTTHHGDWIMDEIYLSDEDFVVHEIEFAFETRWIIYCKNIEYKWLPL
jgi:hypothetical protein